jgi:hypothetical protein
VIEERVVDERIVSGKEAEKLDTEKEDKKTKEEGPGLKWVWLVPEVGYSYINLTSFSQTNFALVDDTKSGLMAGVGAGVRLLFLTLGIRARHHFDADMWQVMLDGGLHFKFGRVDPYLAIRFGYDTVGTNIGQALGNAAGTVNVDINGFNVGTGLGLDYFVADNVTIGFEGSGDFLFLTRPKPALPAGLTAQQKAAIQANPLYKDSGSSVGFGGVLAGRLGFHF